MREIEMQTAYPEQIEYLFKLFFDEDFLSLVGELFGLNRLSIDANQHPHRFAQTCFHCVSKVWQSQFIDYFYCEARPMNNCFYWCPGRDLNPHSLSRNGF